MTRDPTEWLANTPYFRAVVGYQEATDLLNDPRMHADLVAMFEGVGARSGPLWEIMASSFLSINGDEHKRFRGLIAGRFTPRAADGLRPHLRESAHQLIDRFAADQTCELISDFANPFVATGTCKFVGFPLEDVRSLARALDLIAFATKDLGNRIEECEQGVVALVDYAQKTVADRRRNPTDDILTLIARSVDSGALPDSVASGLIACLLSAGHEPTINQLGIMVEVLSHEPDTWDRIGRGTLKPGPVVEEVLRFRSTNQGTNRRVTERLQYQGVEFEDNEQIMVRIAAANHDPCRFSQPDQFDMAANQGSHLAFGFGPHYCLGAALARAQLQEALGALTARLSCPEVLRSVEPAESAGLVGPEILEIAFREREGTPPVGPIPT